MKTFKPTYLYVKTHRGTGLKYFGKTIKDPFKYVGSGTRWLNHLAVHGNNVETVIIGYFFEYSECKNAALEFSKTNNIVNSIEWANLMEETLDGGFIQNSITPEARRKAADTSKNRGTHRGWAPVMKACKEKGTLFTRGMLGKHHSAEAKDKIRAKVKGKLNGSYGKLKFVNPENFNEFVKVLPEHCPKGWISATEKAQILKNKLKEKLIEQNRFTGKSWYNNGTQAFLLLPENAKGLNKGRLKQRKLDK